MKVLVTGGFGNIGKYVVEELINRKLSVRILDLKTKKNLKLSKRLKGIEIYWGDITNRSDVINALKDINVVVHLAFIIPKISSTNFDINKQPKLAEKINIYGTKNLIECMKEVKSTDKIIFTSSVHVYGITQHLPPPRKVDDELNPNDLYSYHKLLCEKMLKESNLKYIIMRLGASITLDLKIVNFIRDLFEIPLDNRIEYVHPKDIAVAIANAIERDDLWYKTFNIGGGKSCQYLYKDFVSKILDAIGIGMFEETLFCKEYFAVDFLDTEESEKLLNYQKRNLNDYINDLKKALSYRKYLIKIFKPIIRYYIISKSPNYISKFIFKNS
ncbi:MAG: NAD(P)-dependent oxidoreductase [Caldisericia bacterium]|jgi:nucleoside-diphosphate-sugar epimerase|nr:NAD(P)-dependent oxidoreductase [Caldisericia bacterium]